MVVSFYSAGQERGRRTGQKLEARERQREREGQGITKRTRERERVNVRSMAFEVARDPCVGGCLCVWS